MKKIEHIVAENGVKKKRDESTLKANFGFFRDNQGRWHETKPVVFELNSSPGFLKLSINTSKEEDKPVM